MRPRKITDEKLPRLIEVARMRLKAEALLAGTPVNKKLAYEIGVTPNYLHNVMHRLTKIMRTGQNVPRETLRGALFNDEQFARLMEKLIAKGTRPRVTIVTQISGAENEKGMM